MKRTSLAWIPRFFILLAAGFAGAQITGWIVISNSEVKVAWLTSYLVYYVFTEILIRFSPVRKKHEFWLLTVFAVGGWLNLLKFSGGLIQAGEISAVNRFEHFLGGVVLFYVPFLLQIPRSLKIKAKSQVAELFIVVLIANFLLVIHEIFELFLDLSLGYPYLIGPSVFDTNLDLLSTCIGTVAGFALQLLLRKLSKPNALHKAKLPKRHVIPLPRKLHSLH